MNTNPRQILSLSALGIAVFAVTLIALRPSPDAVPAPGLETSAVQRAPHEPSDSALIASPVGESQQQEIHDAETEVLEVGEEPAPAFDPEKQPRTYMTDDFRGLSRLPFGYEVNGLILGTAGLTLPPAAPGQENAPRTGEIISPAQPLEFPSNAVAPLWMEEAAKDSDTRIEFQVSPDGEHWGAWQWANVDHDSEGQMEPRYPDGRPNPHYGYTVGGVFVWGDLQYQFVRYRATLYSQGPESPVLSAIRFYYQDTTLGQGRLAEPEEAATQPEGAPQP